MRDVLQIIKIMDVYNLGGQFNYKIVKRGFNKQL